MTPRLSTHGNGRATRAALAALVLSIAWQAYAQTRIVAPKNNYSIADDVKLGREASDEVRKELVASN